MNNKSIKLFFSCLLCCNIIAALTSCSDEFERNYNDALRLSQSFVSIAAQGGSAEITVSSAADWTFEQDGIPAWLTISPMAGTAGKTAVTFTAPATVGALSATLKIHSGSLIQEVNVVQGEVVPETVTIKQANEGADGKTFRVTGSIVRWANNAEKYGNCYIADATGEIQIYGMADKEGKLQNYPLASWGLELGDEITVEGPKTTYNGVAELKDVTVLKVKKSLVKILEPVSTDTVGIEGGEVAVKLAFKGKGVIPSTESQWLRYQNMSITAGVPTAVEPNPADTAIVTFSVEPNMGGDRTGTINFTCTNGSASSSVSFTVLQLGAILEVPVSDFLAAEVGDTQYRMTGVVTELYENDSQGQSFYLKDYSGQALIYRAPGFKESGAKVGDVVTVVGKRGAYNGNPQMTGGTFEALQYSVTEISIAEFLTKPDDKNVYYMVTGTISSLKNDKGQDNNYGNLYLTDGTNELYVYGCYSGWGAPKGAAQQGFISDNGIEVGDQLTMIGYKSTYKGLVELCGGTCFAFKKNEVVHGEDAASPFTVAEAIAKCNEIGTTTDGVIYYAKGVISSIKEVSTEYGNATFNISDDGQDANAITCFRSKSLANQKFVSADEIHVGDEVIICGKLVNYAKNETITPEFSGNVYIYSLNGKTE